MTEPFVAVHVGAGFHSDANSKELKTLCKRACKEAIDALKVGASSSEATALAISILENSTHTNAAIGSNLSLSGTVECDASIMDGDGNFGAVGAVEGVMNPVMLAHTLLKESSQGCLPLGRVPPLVLIGNGAQSWARQRHIATCAPDDLITDRARAVYLDHMARLEGLTHGVMVNGSSLEKMSNGLDPVSKLGEKHSCYPDLEAKDKIPHKKQRLSEDERLLPLVEVNHLPLDTRGRSSSKIPERGSDSGLYRAPLDTVGAICLDLEGRAAAGVSSGGISLKSPGRVGQAAMFGCGCWADNEVVGGNSKAIACSTSGTGEYIIKTTLAKECALSIIDSSLQKALDKHFLNSKWLKNVDQKLAGLIAFNLTSNNVLHFSWGHTTESMCIAYMAGSHREPTAVISKMENPQMSGMGSHVQALRIYT